MSATAKLFMHGRSQAVRLPKEFRFEGTEVRVSKVGNKVVLEPLQNGRGDCRGLGKIDETARRDFRRRHRRPAGGARPAQILRLMFCLDTNIVISVIIYRAYIRARLDAELASGARSDSRHRSVRDALWRGRKAIGGTQ